MANIYVRSSDGSDSDNGSTWALAKASLGGAAAIDVAGDSIYLDSAHSETVATGVVNVLLAGTAAAPVRIISVSSSGSPEPPTTLTAGAVIQIPASSSSEFGIYGHHYVYGVTFSCLSGASVTALRIGGTSAGAVQTYESCKFQLNNVQASSSIEIGYPGTTTGNLVNLHNCDFKFASAGQGLTVHNFRLHINGGSLESGGTSPTSFFEAIASASTGRGATVLVENFDFSNASAGLDLVGVVGACAQATFRNCRLPSAWSGDLVGSTHEPGGVVKMHNCDAGDTNYRMWEQHFNGYVKSDTGHYRSGGASDGVTALSWLMGTTADASFPHVTLDSPEIVRWNDTTGSAVTVTVHVAQEGGSNLDNDEIWLEVNYLGTSGYPRGALNNDDRCGILATPAAQAVSAETWTGFSSATKQKLEATFTPQEKGFIYARVRLARPSTLVYVCPKLAVS